MRKRVLVICILVAMLFTLSGLALAEETAAPATPAPAKSVGTTIDDIKKMLGLSIYLQEDTPITSRTPIRRKTALGYSTIKPTASPWTWPR